MGNSRRDFLALLFCGLGTALSPELLLTRPAWSAPRPDTTAISMVVTGGDKRLATANPLSWASATSSADRIVVDPGQKFQSILGFGGALTDATCSTINGLPADKQNALLTKFFGSGQDSLSLNVCRTCIGASDYSSKAYSFDDGNADPDLKRFSIDHDREYILPVLKKARAINPDLFLFSSPWSPPGWMKSNNSMLGGNMQRRYMPSYAEYFVKFLKGYEEAGVPIQAVTVQNEVDTDQDGKMPACAWPQEYEADFVRSHLGPAFEKHAVKTKIWLIDHNYNLWGRAVGELETPDVTKYASGIAWHGYVGDPGKMELVHKAFPDIDMFWTEGGPDYTDKHYSDNWAWWGKSFSGTLNNWCRSITTWNLALDEVGKPNIGPFSCGGLVTVNSKSGELSYSGQYYAVGHFSKYVKKGAVRLASQSKIEGIDQVAFQNPDGQFVLVVTNGGGERSIKVQVGDRSFDLKMAADSMATLYWS
jgi:glucosylceramidase